MSLTLPATYKALAKKNSIEEIFIVILFSGNETSFISLSTKDFVYDTIHAYGVITEISDITTTINLKESKSARSDVTISCNDVFKNTTLSEELFSGSSNYLNRTVDIYSVLSDGISPVSIANGVHIFQGRLKKIDKKGLNIDLTIEQSFIGDGISIPQNMTGSGNYEPIAYGNFSINDGDTFCTNKAVYPTPYDGSDRPGYKYYHPLSQEETGGNAQLMHYQSDFDIFVPISDCPSNSVTYNAAEQSYYPREFEREFCFRPSASTEGDFIDTDSAVDEEPDSSFTNTYSHLEYMVNGAGNNQYIKEFILDVPYIEGKVTAFQVFWKISFDVLSSRKQFPTSDVWLIIGENTTDANNNFIYWEPSTTPDENNGTWDTENGPNGDSFVHWTTGYGEGIDSVYSSYDFYNASSFDYKVPDKVKLKVEWYAEGGSSLNYFRANVKIHDVYIHVTTSMDWSDRQNSETSFDKLKLNEYVFSGANGFNKSYTGGSGLAELPHEIHRDLLARYTSFNVASPTGFYDLNTARSGWSCRWWLNQKKDLRGILEKLQFEGCFIFIQSPNNGKYIYVKNSYTASDIVQIFDENDYINISISTDLIDDLQTASIYNYVKHPNPNSGKYLETRTYNNSAERTNWLIGNNDNVIQNNLDFIVTDKVYESGSHTSPNDCIALYYDNIKSSPKIIVNFNLINYEKSNLEVGDIVTFNDSVLSPFGKTWGSGDNSLFFMVTELKRSLGYISVTAREVYDNLT